MPFTDVAEQEYGYNAILYMEKTNLMNGDQDGNFYPGAPITWGELCKITARFLENGEKPARITGRKLPEWSRHWAANYILYCLETGILEHELYLKVDFDAPASLKEAHSLFSRTKRVKNLLEFPPLREQNVTAPATRAETAQLVYRICGLTGHAMARTVFRLNKRARWGQSLRLLQQYALCVPFVDSDISMIFGLIGKSSGNSWDADVLRYEHMAKMLKRKGMFRKRDPGAELFHYTSMSALEKLTQENAKFALSNVAYLNDPMEGHLFIRRMKVCLGDERFFSWDFLSKERDELSISNSFVVSFTDQDAEQLPMWVQYAEGAGGCRIGIRTASIQSPLYAIVYDANTVERFLESVRDILLSYLDRAGEVDMNQDIVFSYAAKLLTQVSYLHKDKHYEHEREMRILLFADPSTAKVEPMAREYEIFPRLYIELEDQLEISSITLGPRATGVEKIAVALAGRKYDVNMVRRSEISYR